MMIEGQEHIKPSSSRVRTPLFIFLMVVWFRIFSYIIDELFWMLESVNTIWAAYLLAYQFLLQNVLVIGIAVLLTQPIIKKITTISKKIQIIWLILFIILAMLPITVSRHYEYPTGIDADGNLLFEQEELIPAKVDIRFEADGEEAIPFQIVGSDQTVKLSDKIISLEQHFKFAEPIVIKKICGVSIHLDQEGDQMFWDLTKDNIGKRMGIFIDGELINAHVIGEPLRGGFVIPGEYTEKEAQKLSYRINMSIE